MAQPKDSASKDDGAVVAYWLEKLKREEEAHKAFREQGDAAECALFDERKDGKKNLFPLFWSNVNTLHSALYSSTPRPDVRARNSNTEDPMHGVKKQIGLAIERAIITVLDTTDFDANANRAVDDHLTTGLGVPWVEYEAITDKDEKGNPVSIALQTVKLVHKPWRRFRWEPCQSWEECGWIAVALPMTAAEIKEQFKAEPEAIGASQAKDDKTTTDKYEKTHTVYEIWCKENRTIYVIGQDFLAPLEIRPDALKLEGFYPCPKPLFANLKSRELTPKSDYEFYKGQAEYINVLSQRIENLTQQIKDVGFYDGQLKELASLANKPDGALVPLENLAERMKSAGASSWDAVVAKLPIQDKVEVVKTLIDLREQAKQAVYEITGISDIIRGASVASETATAQQIKGQWASLRLKRRQAEVQQAMRDVFRIFAEIIAEHFNPQQIYLMSGIQLDAQAMQLLKTDVGRTFAIDVETDSTVAADDQAEQENTLKLLEALNGYTQAMVPMVAQNMLPADFAKEVLTMVAGAFKNGRGLEEVVAKLPSTVQQMQQQAQQAQQLQQQLQDCQKQLAEAQKQIAGHDQAKLALDQQDQQRKASETGAGNALKGAQTEKTHVEAQATAMHAQREAETPIVVPIRPTP